MFIPFRIFLSLAVEKPVWLFRYNKKSFKVYTYLVLSLKRTSRKRSFAFPFKGSVLIE